MKLKLVLIVSLVLLSCYAVLFRDYDAISREQAFYATVIVVLGAVPTYVALSFRHEAQLMPLMPLHGLFYALTFGLTALSNQLAWYVADADAKSEALLITIGALLCLYAGYYVFMRPFSRLGPIRILRNVSRKQQATIAWALFLMYLVLELMPQVRALPSVGQLLAPLGYLSIGILYVLLREGDLSPVHRLVVAAAIVLTLVLKLLSGSLANAVFMLIFLSVLHWNRARTLPLHLIAISVAIAVVLNPVKMTYREYTWYSDVELSSAQKAVQLYRAARDYYAGDSLSSALAEDTTTINRLGHISLLAHVMTMTPEVVPYWEGGSYETLWTSFIPRVVWPDKPTATVGQQFGHRYYLLGPNDETTSMNLPWLPEFYANFGTDGVFAGMFLVGLLFRILVQKFSAPSGRLVEHVLGVTMMFSLFYAESNFALMVGGLLLTYLAFLVLLRVLHIFEPRPGQLPAPKAG